MTCTNCCEREATVRVIGLNRQEGVINAELCDVCREHYVTVYEPSLRAQERRTGLEPGYFGGLEIVSLMIGSNDS